VAVDTDRGLLVPVIKDADRKNIVQLSVELAQLSEKARTRKIALEEMQGGCFSISNLGGIGGTYFTPIVNAPEVAILGISRARMEPVFNKESGQFSPRLDAAAVALVRSPRDRRRRRDPFPALGLRSARAAIPVGAQRMIGRVGQVGRVGRVGRAGRVWTNPPADPHDPHDPRDLHDPRDPLDLHDPRDLS
jgi:hypothetical protein